MASRQLQDRIQSLEDILADAEQAMQAAVPQLESIPDIFDVLRTTQTALSRRITDDEVDNMSIAERAKDRLRNENTPQAMIASRDLRNVVARIEASR